MKTLFTKTVFLFATSLFYFISSDAQWSTNPNVDDVLNAKLVSTFNFCSDGHGGAIYTWDSSGCCTYRRIYANRIDSLGFLRWGAKGLLVHSDTVSAAVGSAPRICEDGKGGCYIDWSDNNTPTHPIFCQHLDSNGTKLWGANGKQPVASISTQPYQVDSWLVNDNGKGVFIVLFAPTGDSTNGLRAQRLNFNGAKQWGDRGVLVEKAGDVRQPKAISDGNNGIVIAWANYSFDGLGHQFQIRMNHLNRDGLPRFTFGNKKLNNVEAIGFSPFFRLMLTKKKNIIAVWLKDGNASKLYTQRIDLVGNFLWGGSEITVCDTTGIKQFPDILTDGSEGAYYVWNDGRKAGIAYGIFAQHLNNSGVRKWQYQGVCIDSNARAYAPYFAPDVNKGMKIFWESSPSNREYMQQLDKNGVAQIAGIGTAVAAASHNPFSYRSVQPASNNHDILFLETTSGICYAKYVPLDGAMPLTFLQFNAVNKDSKNILSWQTASEINTSYFSLERSENGNEFNEIAKLKSVNTSSVNNYSYEDVALSNANIYYRLKEVDEDGKYTYSKIVSLHQNSSSSIQIIPNPAVKNCTIYFGATTHENVVLKIFNVNGRQQKQIILTAKQSSVMLDVSSFSAGIYFCKLEAAGKTFTQKLIVTK